MASDMPTNSILALPFSFQVALAAGYMGYAVAYAGYRRARQPVDATFMSLIFGVPAFLIMQASDDLGTACAAGMAIATALGLGIFWRVAGRHAWLWVMGDLGVHQEDGSASAWDTLIQRSNLLVQQCSVRTKDGRTLFLNSRDKYIDLPHKGLVLGGSGDILMVVEEERLPGSETDREAKGVVTDNGVRVAYIPATEIAQVNLRIL